MGELSVSLLEGAALKEALPRFALEIRQLTNLHRKKTLNDDQKILNQIMGLISQGRPSLEWDASLVDQFLQLCTSVLRRSLDQIERANTPDLGQIERAQRQIDTACSLAISSVEMPPITREDLGGLWTRSRLIDGPPSMDATSFVEFVASLLAPLASPQVDLRNQIRAQLIILASLIPAGELSDDLVDHVREWCQSLVSRQEFRSLLAASAKTLGIELPALPPPLQTPDEPLVSTEERVSTLLDAPGPLSEGELGDERDRILIALYGESGHSDSPLTQHTKGQINDLLPDSPANVLNSAYYYAGLNLWKGYWTSGDTEFLVLPRDIARYLYATYSTHPGKDRERSNSLQMWISTQLAEWLLTYGADQLLDEIGRLGRRLKCKLNDLATKESIIEALAGECHRREREGLTDDRAALIAEYGPSLRKIHRDYQEKAATVMGTAWIEKSREDELAAWEYLFPASSDTLAPTGPQAEGDLIQPEISTILDDMNFRTVIRGGDHHEIYEFIGRNREHIEELLGRRLRVKIAPAYVMSPEGSIRDPRGAKRNQENPDFVAARTALKRGEFPRASKLFKNLADRLDGFLRNMACNYQAYAEAKAGDTLEARRLLNPVCDTNFTYASAYWNLACCLPSTETGQQLETIVKGLEVAPHPKLLDAAVYLGLFLKDERVREWLPCEVKAEGLLLFYHMVFGDSQGSERERFLMALATYVRNGEPIIPDPTKVVLHQAEIWKFINALLDGQQTDAIEFWLRCRALVASKRYDYWEVKTDYYERMNRPSDAAVAFKEELSCRLNLLRGKLQRGEKDIGYITKITRERAQRWLRQCMTAALKPNGLTLYNMLSTFESSHQNKVQLVPQTRRILEFYRPGPAPLPPPPPEPEKRAKMSEILTTVGAECHKQLHDAAALASVSTYVEELLSALRARGNQGSASALHKLLIEWKTYTQHATEADKGAALQKAKGAFADLKAKLQRELTEQEFVLASPLMAAFNRVNDRLVRDLELLPDLAVEAVEGNTATIDSAAPRTAFSVRVRTKLGDLTTVRLTQARAILEDDGRELRLRDDLALLPVFVGPGITAVLSFEVDSPYPQGSDWGNVRIDLSYECKGTEIHAPSCVVPLTRAEYKDLPDRSPYIHMRPIEPDEIEGHFFGRENEQEQILDSVSDGQQRIRYVEGIRRSGKSSLLSSIAHEVEKRSLHLVPIYFSVADAPLIEQAGRVLYNLYSAICKDAKVTEAGVRLPDEGRCVGNPTDAYTEFETELASKMPNERVLAMVDDFQELVLAAAALRTDSPAFYQGVIGILNLIRGRATPKARLLWLFAGQNAARRYKDKDMLPGCLLWATWRALPIDFLTIDAVQSIIREPLRNTEILIPDETVARVHFLTSGHPEPVQQIAEIILNKTIAERRHIFSPADADLAAVELAKENDDTFADTWFPTSELTDDEQSLVAALVNAVPVGGRIELFKLAPNNQVTEELKSAVDDLIARKIFDDKEDGTIGIRAPVLDLWLHGNWIKRVHSSGGFNGNAAIFIDVANLTAGSGAVFLTDLDTANGEGRPGRFSLGTVLDSIEGYVHQLTPAPVAARWASNYPRGCPAIMVCDAKDYLNVNVPDGLHQKGSDDLVLMWKVEDVEKQYRRVNHFVLVTGDKDFRELAHRLLQNGHFVHVISRASALGRSETQYSYDRLARDFPKRFNVVRLEDLLDQTGLGPS